VWQGTFVFHWHIDTCSPHRNEMSHLASEQKKTCTFHGDVEGSNQPCLIKWLVFERRALVSLGVNLRCLILAGLAPGSRSITTSNPKSVFPQGISPQRVPRLAECLFMTLCTSGCNTRSGGKDGKKFL
jgi:hypothetical protein